MASKTSLIFEEQDGKLVMTMLENGQVVREPVVLPDSKTVKIVNRELQPSVLGLVVGIVVTAAVFLALIATDFIGQAVFAFIGGWTLSGWLFRLTRRFIG